MNKKLLNQEDREHLSDFKRLFIYQYMTGKLPREIFEASGFDVNVISIKRIENSEQNSGKRPASKGGL